MSLKNLYEIQASNLNLNSQISTTFYRDHRFQEAGTQHVQKTLHVRS